MASETQDAVFQRATIADLDESVTLHLHDQSPPRLTRFARTLRDDGVEYVADVALAAVVDSRPNAIGSPQVARVPRKGSPWHQPPPDLGK